MSFPVVKVWSLWLCLVGVFSGICFGGVGLLAADMAKCQATRPKQCMCLLLVAKWKSILQSQGYFLNEVAFLFSAGKVFSLDMCCSYSLSGVSGICYLWNLFYSFFITLHTVQSLSRDIYTQNKVPSSVYYRWGQ